MSPEFEATAGDWVYISCHTIVNLGGGLTWSKECDACRNTNLRYIHTLAHIDDDERIVQVGIECARVLMGPRFPGLQRMKPSAKSTGASNSSDLDGVSPQLRT